jgi:hypothetical protein
MNALRCPMDDEAADTDDDVAIAAMATVATLHLILVIFNEIYLGMK